MSYGVHVNETYYLGPALEHYRFYKNNVPSIGGIRTCAAAQLFLTYVAAPMLSPTTKILLAYNELVNALKQPSTLLTTFDIPDHLAALKNIANIFETAASSRPVPNTNILAQPASVQLAPIHVPQTQKNQVKIYSTPVTTTPEMLANVNISAPTSITYNESELGPPSLSL